MISQRALYWIAVALMVLFLGNHFAVKYDRCLRVSLQSSPVPAVVARLLDKNPCFAPRRVVTPTVEAGFASVQAEIAHQQAAYAVLEAERARMMAMRQIESLRVRGICPRPSVRITVPEQPVSGQGRI